jgi:hypothetical protein
MRGHGEQAKEEDRKKNLPRPEQGRHNNHHSG